MTRFIINFTVFGVLLLAFYMFTYWAYYKVSLPESKNAVYVWGDSQMKQGLELDYLNNNTPYHFYSAAAHGAGIYDFLVFTELVPANSNVIIQISSTVLLRRKSVDRNISALDIKALNQLRRNNYSFKEIYSIVKKNILPLKIFADTNSLYPIADTITLTEPMSLFTTVYAQKPTYFNDKKTLYAYAISNLIYKNCKIIAVCFPDNPILSDIQRKSPYADNIVEFEKEIGNFFPRKEIIELTLKGNYFYDLTHLNSGGAQFLTKKITSKLQFGNDPMLIKVAL